jgi:DNA-binding beta-propeller fold protein YncE
VSTLAGLAGSSGSDDGTGSAARFRYPHGVAVDSAGNVYVADFNSTIRKITQSGVVSTLAGLAGSIGSADGTGSAARFYNPQGVAVDAADNVYVADTLNHAIRKGWVSPLRVFIAPDGSGGFFIRVQGRGNLSYQLQRAQTLNGQWTTNAVQTAPGSGLVEFHDPSPPSDRGFYRAFQE